MFSLSKLNFKFHDDELLFNTLKLPSSSCSLIEELELLNEKSTEFAIGRLSILPLIL